MRDSFMEVTAEYYGAAYAQILSDLTPPWIIVPLLILAVVGGMIGNAFTKKALGKHFRKAGIV